MHETLDVPSFEVALAGVEVDREVEEVRDEGGRRLGAPASLAAGREHVEPLDDQDVRPVDHHLRVGHDVVGQVRVDGGGDLAAPRLHVGDEAQQRRAVVALRKALAAHQPLALEHGIREQEAVGGDEVDARRVGPALQQRAHDAGEGRLAGGDRTGDADDVGDLAVVGAEEALRRLEQPLRRRDVEREQTGQRQIDLDHLFKRDRLVGRAQPDEVLGRQRQRRVGAQRGPMGAVETMVGRVDRKLGAVVHEGLGLSGR